MTPPDFSREIQLKLSLAHALLAWETLSGKFSALHLYDELSEAERRAIWKLADALESLLVGNGILALPPDEWQKLLEDAGRQFMNA